MKKKIAVLHAQVPYVRGGAELMTENLTKQLKLRGYDAELIAIPFKWYPNNVLLDSYFLWNMLDLSESNGQKIDLVIATKVPTYMIQHPNKVVWLMHQHRQAYDLQDNVLAGGLNTIYGGKELQKKIKELDNFGFSTAKNIYSISKTVSKRLQNYNGIFSYPLYHPPALEGKYFSEDYTNYILSVGRLDLNKRVDLLIRALPYCNHNICAIIAGTGAMRPTLESLADELGVSDRVKFLGFVPDEKLPELYANAFAVFFAPLDEDYGYITLEAFLSQKPVVTSRNSGGVLEFVEDNKNGIVCSDIPEEMGKAFEELFCDKVKAKEYGRAGFEKVKDINWDNVIYELTKTIR